MGQGMRHHQAWQPSWPRPWHLRPP
ncbi:hypothetical protein HaLaN_31497, partial [Haematococcus lacustris]